MEKDMNIITIETILDRLGIDLDTLDKHDAADIVNAVLVCMIEESEKELEGVEIPIGDMLWTDQN